MSKKINRKEFIKKTTTLGLGATIYPRFKSNFKHKDKVRIGFIGTGLRGQWLLDLASKRDDVLIPAICDIDNQMIERTLNILNRNSKNTPDIYRNGEAYVRPGVTRCQGAARAQQGYLPAYTKAESIIC